MEDGFSEAACECVIEEISDVTDINEFDLANIEGVQEDYIEVTG